MRQQALAHLNRLADPQVDGGKHADHAGGSRTFSEPDRTGWVRIRILVEHAQFSECPNLPNGQLVPSLSDKAWLRRAPDVGVVSPRGVADEQQGFTGDVEACSGRAPPRVGPARSPRSFGRPMLHGP